MGHVNGFPEGLTKPQLIPPIMGYTMLNDTEEWCVLRSGTQLKPIYVSGQLLGSKYENKPIDLCANFVPPSQSPGQCKIWYCDSKTGQAVITGSLTDTPCDDGNACTTGETCSWGSCQNGALTPPPAGDACQAPAYCDPKQGYVFEPVIKCAENQYCDKYLEACVVNTSDPKCEVKTMPIGADPFGIFTFKVKPCDKIVVPTATSQQVLTVKEINYTPGNIGVDLIIQSNNKGDHLQYERYINHLGGYANVGFATYKSDGDLNLANILPLRDWFVRVNDVENDNGATLRISSCHSELMACLMKNDYVSNKQACYKVCDAKSYYNLVQSGSFDGSQLSVSASSESPKSPAWTQSLSVYASAPPQYKGATKYAAYVGECDLQALSSLFGITPKGEMTVVMNVQASGSTSAIASCNLGDEHGSVGCYVNQDVDTALDPKFEQLSLVKQGTGLIYSNICWGPFLLFGSLSHEMAHQFAIKYFSVLNSEGLAEYAEDTVTPSPNKLFCDDTGYSFTQNGSVINPYTAWTTGNYHTGACFWMEVRKTYGDEMFRKIFQHAHTLKRGKYKMFQDIIHPIVKDDFFNKVKTKYKFTEDPLLTQKSQNFFD